MNKLIVEFIGTFFLVTTIGLTVMNQSLATTAPIAIGAVLMVMVYAGGHISGAHYNPAVSTAVLIRGKITPAQFVSYIVAQILGAIAAAAVVITLKGNATPVTINLTHALIAEGLFTFALAYVVLNVATAPANEGNSFYGLAIGFTVLSAAYAVGNISGAALNPAVVIGATVIGLLPVSVALPYILVNLVAGGLAAVVFKLVITQTTTGTALTEEPNRAQQKRKHIG